MLGPHSAYIRPSTHITKLSLLQGYQNQLSMEANLSNDTLANSTDLLADDLLPIGAVAFAPVLLLELVAAVVSNIILLALVILACVHKLNNNINIYLFSLGLNGLLGAFTVFCLLTVTIARRWILGRFTCILNWFTFNVSYIFYFMIYVIISRDKYVIVKDVSLRPNKKRAYLLSTVIWTLSIAFGLLVSVRRTFITLLETHSYIFYPCRIVGCCNRTYWDQFFLLHSNPL